MRTVREEESSRFNAIQIYPTSSTNVWIRYYVDLTTQQLCEVDNEDTNVSFMASSITNKVPFTAEDFAGNITSNEQPKEVIGVLLQIDQVLVKRKSKTQTANGQTSDVKPDLTDYFEFRTRFNKRNDLGYQR